MKRIIILLLALMPLAVWAQVIVKGTVKDDLGEVLVGATILEVNNPGNGTITDIDGKFSIKLKSSKAKIKVSYIGYASQTVTATNGMVISMEADGNMLQEVEIVQQGFGTKSRLSNVASISQVNGMYDLKAIAHFHCAECTCRTFTGTFPVAGKRTAG